MADNITVTPGTGKTILADEITTDGGTGLAQRIKILVGAPGSGADAVPGAGLPVAADSAAADVAVTITRPANTTAYAANDVVGGALTFASIGPNAGAIMITGAQLRYDVGAVPTGMGNMRLYLYNVTPPSALADNAAWDLPNGDRASFLGYIDIGSLADLGSTLYVETNNINKQLRLASTAIYGYLVTIAGFTPAANSETLSLTLHSQAV